MSMSSGRSFALNEFDFKVIIIGRYGVGKSSLLHRFIHGVYSAYIKPNARVETEDLRITKEDNQVRLRLWDTAGQERFRSLTNSYYRDTNAVILAFDVTSDQSYRDIEHWYDDVKKLQQPNGKDVFLIVIGTKSNLTDQREVSEHDGHKWAYEKNLDYIEVSAETGANVSALFDKIVYHLIQEQAELRSARTEQRLLAEVPEKPKVRCCVVN